jgi:hypothetical protein
MKKLLIIALVAGGFLFAGAPHSEAQVSFSIGFGFPGYYGYYYPYRYYRPYFRHYYRPYYWYRGHRYYRHGYPYNYYRH